MSANILGIGESITLNIEVTIVLCVWNGVASGGLLNVHRVKAGAVIPFVMEGQFARNVVGLQ